jgi:hypothetical protein
MSHCGKIKSLCKLADVVRVQFVLSFLPFMQYAG